MYLLIDGHNFQYEIENICRIFLPAETLKLVFEKDEIEGEDYALTSLKKGEGGEIFISALVSLNGKSKEEEAQLAADTAEQEVELAISDCLFRAFCELLNYNPPWGLLTGVRPTKLMRSLIEEKGERAANSYFQNSLRVTAEKTKLAADIVEIQRPFIELLRERSFSLYISIPFCPTRCSYCSFVSHSIASAKNLIPEYVELLSQELELTAKIAKELGLRLDTVYFGGGTPTALDSEDIEHLTRLLSKHFNMEGILEYTVEAGRPDTITKDKLEVLKRAGVTRLSINPQSFDDRVLENIGRQHSSKQTIEAFLLARELGFDNINMDFIAGLPGDSPEIFAAGLEKATSLGAENITVHTLAFKRSSSLVTEQREGSVFESTAELLDISKNILSGAGYEPYYMYRQSKTVGNLENIGWAKKDLACLYNIYMMEELHTVLAVGAGGVTKLRAVKSNYIERIFNFKYPYEYINRFEDIKIRKERIEKFYGEH